ncbi:hypothetical protein [Stenotrophomonas maltophilia]|uniref:hypothetical protein n=1 Tax=Stenotrophomonas maltophilia TaxID=40324 RepID=UPI001660E2AA|nr:hypothetical protein [Stenotrophomonas maltophilia]
MARNAPCPILMPLNQAGYAEEACTLDAVITGHQYGALEGFVAAISTRNRKALSERFLVQEDVIEEIFEAISDYFDDEVSITTPQRKMTSVPGNARPLVDAYYTNAGTVIVDCVLLADGIPDEAILHVEFVDDSDRLHYRYIGS